MTFGFSIWPENVSNGPTSVDMNYPSYGSILGTGAKSSWSEVISDAAVTTACHGVFVEVAKTATGATDTSAVLDIGVDAAGGSSYSAVISNLLVGFADDPNANTGNGGVQQYFIPLESPSGAAVAIRGQTNGGAALSASVRVSLWGAATGPYSGATCTTYGVSGTNGTEVTPGNDSAWGSWTSIGGTTATDLQAISIGVQPKVTAGAINRNAYQLQIGVSSAAISGIYDVKSSTTETFHGPRPVIPTYYYVASGAQLQVRARGVSGSIDNLYVALYGVSAT
jgi:hypothetical protein